MVHAPFAKYHGLGNDFILLDCRDRDWPVDAAVARRLCDRHRGIGADGVIRLLPAEAPQAFRMHVYNSDGSEAEMCGNGLRCAVMFSGLLGTIGVETGAGLLEGERLADGRVRVTLGRPALDGEQTVEVPASDAAISGRVVRLGNPHFVLPLQDGDPLERARALGEALSTAPDFPRGINVGFPKLSSHGLELVVHERGAGLTQACGTGAAAAVCAHEEWGHLSPGQFHRVDLPGGPLEVRVLRDGQGHPVNLEIVGEAVEVFRGEVEL